MTKKKKEQEGRDRGKNKMKKRNNLMLLTEIHQSGTLKTGRRGVFRCLLSFSQALFSIFSNRFTHQDLSGQRRPSGGHVGPRQFGSTWSQEIYENRMVKWNTFRRGQFVPVQKVKRERSLADRDRQAVTAINVQCQVTCLNLALAKPYF